MIIPITHKSKGTQDLIIDDEDYDLIKNYNWRLNITSNKYTYYVKSVIYKIEEIRPPTQARPNTTKKIFKYDKTINIHRLIMGLGDYKDDKRIVNHKNGNGLDNRKCNLEICSSMYNSQSINKPHQKFGTIYIDTSGKRIKRWRAHVTIMGVKHQSRFKTKEEAQKYLCCLELLQSVNKKN